MGSDSDGGRSGFDRLGSTRPSSSSTPVEAGEGTNWAAST